MNTPHTPLDALTFVQSAIGDLLRSEQTRLRTMNDQLREHLDGDKFGAKADGQLSMIEVAAGMTESQILHTTRAAKYAEYLELLRLRLMVQDSPAVALQVLRKKVERELADLAMAQVKQSASAANNARGQASLSAMGEVLSLFLDNLDD